jgi:uncharacterized protein
MAGRPIVDSGFLVALLSRRDGNHRWAVAQAQRFPPLWRTCEAALSESFHLLGAGGGASLAALLRRRALVSSFDLNAELDRALKLMTRYADVPMSLADACLVRMTETLADPVVVTTDSDFRIYRRHNRLAVPCVLPP